MQGEQLAVIMHAGPPNPHSKAQNLQAQVGCMFTQMPWSLFLVYRVLLQCQQALVAFFGHADQLLPVSEISSNQ
jgi:hypothetical protein